MYQIEDRLSGWPDEYRLQADQTSEQYTEDWLYVRIACQPTEADPILLHLVAPLVQHLGAQGLIRQCFFIRYAEGGYHLRVRFFGARDDLFGVVRTLVNEHIRAYFAVDKHNLCEPLDWGPEGVNDRFWQSLYADNELRPVPSYEYHRYEPEIERYGGLRGLLVSEHHFAYSSATALQVLAQEQAGNSSRRNAALVLLHALAEGFQLNAEQKAESFEQFYLRRRTLVWRTPPNEHDLEQEYERNRVILRMLIPCDLYTPVHRGRATWLPLAERWQMKVRETYRMLQQLQEQDALSVLPVVIMSAYIHMLCNRLGIYPREEAYLCYLLYRTYTERLNTVPDHL